jgi:hypothetical protein
MISAHGMHHNLQLASEALLGHAVVQYYYI